MQDNFFKRLTSAHLKRAAELKARIENLEVELTTILGIPQSLTVGNMIRNHQRISAATRAKISASMRARWAKVKANKK